MGKHNSRYGDICDILAARFGQSFTRGEDGFLVCPPCFKFQLKLASGSLDVDLAHLCGQSDAFDKLLGSMYAKASKKHPPMLLWKRSNQLPWLAVISDTNWMSIDERLARALSKPGRKSEPKPPEWTEFPPYCFVYLGFMGVNLQEILKQPDDRFWLPAAMCEEDSSDIVI
jgi:hypothetical protein